jgi:hypothetical protein
MSAKRIFHINRMEFLWIILIVMLGVDMYWTASLINPVRQISEDQLLIARVGITQNERIIQILSNETSTNETKNIIANIIGNNTTGNN